MRRSFLFRFVLIVNCPLGRFSGQQRLSTSLLFAKSLSSQSCIRLKQLTSLDATEPSIPIFVDCKRLTLAVLQSMTVIVAGIACKADTAFALSWLTMHVVFAWPRRSYFPILFDWKRLVLAVLRSTTVIVVVIGCVDDAIATIRLFVAAHFT